MAQSRIERMLNEVRITSYGKLAILTIVAAVAGLFLAVTSLTSGELSAGEAESPPYQSGNFTYFPSQYVNQATEPSEHIQAF